MKPVQRDDRRTCCEHGQAEPGCGLAVHVDQVVRPRPHDVDQPAPELGRPRRRVLSQIHALEAVSRHGAQEVDVRLAAAAAVGQHVEHGSLRPRHTPRAPSRATDRGRGAPRFGGTTRASSGGAPSPDSMDADDGGCELVRRRRACDRSVHALLDELGGGVVRALDDDRGHASRGGFDHDAAVALPPGGQQEAERARERPLEHVGVDEARRARSRRRAAPPRSRAAPPRARGRRRRARRAARGSPPLPARARARARAPASRG